MYQTVGTNSTLAIAKALEKPIYRRPIMGKPKIMSLQYAPEEGDEVEDLQLLVQDVLVNIHFNLGSSSLNKRSFQRSHLFHLPEASSLKYVLQSSLRCKRHGLTSIAYLWHRNQSQLLDEMINYGMNAILIKVACFGLNKSHLGQSIKDLRPHFHKLQKQCEMNVCGQGGEYESLVLDCPHYKKRLNM